MRPLISLAARMAAPPALLCAPRVSVLVSLQQARCLAQTRTRRQDDESWPPPPPPPLPGSPPTETAAPKGDQPSSSPARSIPGSKELLQSIYGTAADHASTAPSSPPPAPAGDVQFEILIKTIGQTKSSSSKLNTKVLDYPDGAISLKNSEVQPHHLHVYSHKHNTHITCTRPNRDPIISLSCGNLGYKKARRGTFDSAYSLTKYVLERLSAAQVEIDSLELILCGYGPGREAAVKVLLSPEGRNFRSKIVRVADSTPIKFAGKRSKKPRRL